MVQAGHTSPTRVEAEADVSLNLLESKQNKKFFIEFSEKQFIVTVTPLIVIRKFLIEYFFYTYVDLMISMGLTFLLKMHFETMSF